MSGQPAARIGDTIACAVPQTTPAALPHAPPPGLPIIPPGAIQVVIGGKPAARMGDQSICVGPAPLPNPILKGAFPVPISGMPAARLTDQGTHPGSVIMPPCCPTVLIGLSGTAGNVRAGTQACQAAAAGRASGTTAQSTGNCGIESSRQVINHANGSAVTEGGLLGTAQANGFANPTGGSTATQQANLLTSQGVPASTGAANLGNTALALSQGRGVVANLDAAALWPTTHGINQAPGAWHAVTVTGATFDDAGNMTSVTINDTGPSGGPNCGIVVPANVFNNAMAARPDNSIALVTTNNPIW